MAPAPAIETERGRTPAPRYSLRPLAGVPAPAMARLILAVVVTGFCLVAALRIFSTGLDGWEYALCVVLMLAVLALQVFYFTGAVAGPQPPSRYAALLVQAALVYLPMFIFEESWIGLPGFFAGSVLLVLPFPIAWLGFALVVVSVGAAQADFTGAPNDIAYSSTATIITGLVVYGLTRLANTVAELHAARSELANMAVAQERLRFARDLHDLLGYSLSAITLKSELTRRLVVTHPVRAQEELVELLEISRRALADVRSVASGYRELSLDTEARSARSVLLAADVDARVELEFGDVPQHVRTLLATVLREGVTNVLRHSKAEHCEITVKQEKDSIALDIVNDGTEDPTPDDSVAGPVPVGARVGGSGIGNLSARLAAVGGTLHAGSDPDGRWRLRAVVRLP